MSMNALTAMEVAHNYVTIPSGAFSVPAMLAII